MTNKESAESFIISKGYYKGGSTNLYCDGEGRMFSYNTVVAKWVSPIEIWMTSQYYSRTTTRHLSHITSAALLKGIRITYR